jgi:hypothetical protein
MQGPASPLAVSMNKGIDSPPTEALRAGRADPTSPPRKPTDRRPQVATEDLRQSGLGRVAVVHRRSPVEREPADAAVMRAARLRRCPGRPRPASVLGAPSPAAPTIPPLGGPHHPVRTLARRPTPSASVPRSYPGPRGSAKTSATSRAATGGRSQVRKGQQTQGKEVLDLDRHADRRRPDLGLRPGRSTPSVIAMAPAVTAAGPRAPVGTRSPEESTIRGPGPDRVSWDASQPSGHRTADLVAPATGRWFEGSGESHGSPGMGPRRTRPRSDSRRRRDCQGGARGHRRGDLSPLIPHFATPPT